MPRVSQYLDGFSGRPAGAITIRQLLSHTSGFSTLQGNAVPLHPWGRPNAKDVLERSVDASCRGGSRLRTGERWEYSNLNYQILGRLIEVVSGQEFQAYVAAEHPRAGRYGAQLRRRR